MTAPKVKKSTPLRVDIPEEKDCILSDHLDDCVRTLCKVCGSSFTLTHMRTHTLSQHQMQITKYKEIHGPFQIIRKVFHKCHICDKLVLLDSDALGGHIKGVHKMKEREYKEKYLTYSYSRSGQSTSTSVTLEPKMKKRKATSTIEVDLNHNVKKSHKVQTKYKEGFTCKLCGVNVSEMETFKIHQSQGHNVLCYLDGCDRRFQHKKELVSHLKTQHNVVQIRIGNDSEEEHRGYLTTERSQANIDIAEWAESWIDSPLAVEHMKKVMKGVVKSMRHDLFLDERERDQCSGSETSRLYQLSNPGFLDGEGEKDTVVIKHLINRVFMEYFHEADTKLVELGNGTAFVYASCVLFPETFIHQHMVQGKKSREEAEQAFMEVAVDEEERKGLNQEFKEAAVQNRRDNDEDSGDEWVDHSDMEDDLDE